MAALALHAERVAKANYEERALLQQQTDRQTDRKMKPSKQALESTCDAPTLQKPTYMHLRPIISCKLLQTQAQFKLH